MAGTNDIQMGKYFMWQFLCNVDGGTGRGNLRLPSLESDGGGLPIRMDIPGR
jgi:hypothetical protein